MASENSKLPLKILCIHGYRQNAQTFRERTGAFRKIIKKHAELVFISAPNQVPSIQEDDTPNQTDQMGWWFSALSDKFDAHDDTDCCKGYGDSLKVIEDVFVKEGPFDGVLGFSQGASVVSLMCALAETQDTPIKFNFAILVAGFKSRSSGHNELYEKQISMPTLHVFGDTDKVIEKDMSEHLLQYFNEPKVLSHTGGHFIPASSAQKKVYLEFLNDMIELKNITLKKH